METLLFVFCSVLLIVLGIAVKIYFNWNESKVLADKLRGKRGMVFKNLKISSISSGKRKSLLGFEVSSQIFIHPDYIFILAQRISLSLFQTELPMVLDRKSGFVPESVKMNSWNSLSIVIRKQTLQLGDTTIEFFVEPESKEEGEVIYNQLKNWIE